MEFEVFGIFIPPLYFRGGPGNPKTVDVMAYKPDFHTHKSGRESCAIIVDASIVPQNYIYSGFACFGDIESHSTLLEGSGVSARLPFRVGAELF
jgi:hypothetical protein